MRSTCLLVLALAPCACSSPGSELDGIIIITLDTTRADRIGAYGYREASTPNLDALAARGTLFEYALSAVPVTLPSHATMFTGMYPPQHGVRYNGMFRLSDEAVTVPEVLRDAGWNTAAVPAAYPVYAGTGLDQGFETYRDLFSEPGAEDLDNEAERIAEEVTDLGIEWIRERPAGPFFLWLHYFDAHAPYRPPFPYSAEFRDRPYDGEIAYTDSQIGRLLAALQEGGLDERVAVVVAGDHGEGLYDHGERWHSTLAYDSTMRVPLIVVAPGSGPGARVLEPVSLADVAPTLLDLAGVSGPSVAGISLVPATQGHELPRRALYFESLAGALSYGWSPLEGIVRGRWKYIRSVAPELFDIESDPEELQDRAGSDADRVADLDRELQDLLSKWEVDPNTAETVEVPLSQEELDRLAALGYVGGQMSEASRDGRHPRDLTHLESAIQFARVITRAGRFSDSIPAWETVLDADPDNRHALNAMAVSLARVGRTGEAIGLARHLTELYPEFIAGHVVLGEIHVTRGEFDAAVEAFDAGRSQNPDDNGLRYRHAVALYAADRLQEARETIREALDSRGDPEYLVLLAACLASEGDHIGAGEALRAAIAGGYEKVEVLRKEPLLEPLRTIPGFEAILSTAPDRG